MAENISTGLHFLPVHTLTWYRDHLAAARFRSPRRPGATVLSLPLGGATARQTWPMCLPPCASCTARSRDEPALRVGLGHHVSAVVLAALLWFTDPAQIWDTLSAADLRWIAAATPSTSRRFR